MRPSLALKKQHDNQLKPIDKNINDKHSHLVELQHENHIFIEEMVRTFIFLFGAMSFHISNGLDFHFFLSLLICLPICKSQSAPNLNPSISLSAYLKHKQSQTLPILWTYIKAQISGALLAFFSAFYLNGVYRPLVADPEIVFTSEQIARKIISQAMGVFILVYFILHINGSYNYIHNPGARYLFISIFVHIARKFAVSSGNQINMASSLARAMIGLLECNFAGFRYLYIWIVGDLIGLVLALFFYDRIVFPTLDYIQKRKKYIQQEEEKTQLLKQNV